LARVKVKSAAASNLQHSANYLLEWPMIGDKGQTKRLADARRKTR
jgi:hypothetical protein